MYGEGAQYVQYQRDRGTLRARFLSPSEFLKSAHFAMRNTRDFAAFVSEISAHFYEKSTSSKGILHPLGLLGFSPPLFVPLSLTTYTLAS